MPRPTPRARLTAQIAERLRSLLRRDAVAVTIYGAKGFYRTAYADVMSWTGYVDVNGQGTYDIGSWNTMTACLRGFDLIDNRSDPTMKRYSDFEAMAKNPHAVALGKKGGKATSERKAAAARANGKLGGRPKKANP